MKERKIRNTLMLYFQILLISLLKILRHFLLLNIFVMILQIKCKKLESKLLESPNYMINFYKIKKIYLVKLD